MGRWSPPKNRVQASSSGEHVQLFRMVYDRKKGFQAEATDFSMLCSGQSAMINSVSLPIAVACNSCLFENIIVAHLTELNFFKQAWGHHFQPCCVPVFHSFNHYRFKSCSCVFSSYLLLCACMCEERKAWETNVEHHKKNGVTA